MFKPPLNQGTVQAYRQTHYGVRAGEARFALRIGQHSAALDMLQRRHGVTCSAYLTAFNPYSQPLTAAQNAARHGALLQVLQRQGLTCLPGTGRHPAGRWPGERSVLVLGLTQDAAALLGGVWQQNAVVVSGADAVPQLLLLR